MVSQKATGSWIHRVGNDTLLAVVLIALMTAPPEAGAQSTHRPLVYPGAVITVTKPIARRSYARAAARWAPISNRFGLSAHDVGPGVVFIEGVVQKSRPLRARVKAGDAPRGYQRRFDLCRTGEIKHIVRRLRGGVCEPNYAFSISRAPDDLYFPSQYAHRILRAETAWDSTTGREDLLALVVDSGIDYTHPDLIENVWRNPGEIPGNRLDDDGNGVVDDVFGYNAITNSGDPFDDNGHGTHVAGIIGARGNNRTGVAGVAWNIKLVGVKFLNRSGMGSLINAIKAIEYGTALQRAGYKVVVSNNSWGSLSKSVALEGAIERAGEAGILFVAAAGNSKTDTGLKPFYPASYRLPNVVAVASVDNRGNLSSFSNYGATSVHLAAPGSSIMSTYPRGRYVLMSGTSMAAPAVSGVALLMQSMCLKSFTPAALKEGLLNTAASHTGLFRKLITAGIVDATAGVAEATERCAALPEPIPTPRAPVPATPTAIPTATPTSKPSATPTPTATPTATPRLSPSPSPTPRFAAASFSATVATDRGGVPGAEISWHLVDSSQVLLTQRTNFLGRIMTTVVGDDFWRRVAPQIGAPLYATVRLPPGYRSIVTTTGPMVLGAQNSVVFKADPPPPPR